MADDFQVRPRLAPERPKGYQAPASPNLNQADPTLDTLDFRKPRQAKDDLSPYARRDFDNNFFSNAQKNMRLVGWREALAIITDSGTELDIANFSYFLIRSVGGSDFTVNLPTPPVLTDPLTGDPIRQAWGVTVDIEYTGAGKPVFVGASLPDDGNEPEWSSESGKLDTVVLTWAERWLLRKASFGYAI